MHAATFVAPETEDHTSRKVLEAIQEIEQENERQTAQHVSFLKSVRNSLLEQLNKINMQFAHIEEVIESLSESAEPPPRHPGRRRLAPIRHRVLQWMGTRNDDRLCAADLLQQFPELQGVQISIFFKPLIDAGLVTKDSSRGNRKTYYFIPAAH